MSTTEKKAAETILDNGLVFKTRRKYLKWLLGKEVAWYIRPSKLGTLMILSGLYLRYELKEADLNQAPIKTANYLAAKAARNYARVAAIAVLNGKWKIRFFARPLAGYFLWALTPRELLQLVTVVIEANNVLDFMTSIRLTSGIARMMTAPRNLSPTGEHGG